MKRLRWTVVVTSLAVFISPFAGAAQDKQERLISVQGQGKVFVVPDIARVSVEVSNDGPEVDPVLAQVRRDMSKVLEAVKGQGIAEKDVHTEMFQVRPKFEHTKLGNPKRVGYSVTNRASVKIRDNKKIGKVLSSVLNAGATTVDGPVFELDNPAAAEREAMALATRDAKAKAETVAEAAGVRLGEILSINPQNINWPNPRVYMARASMVADSAAEPIAAGEQTIMANVQLTFAIQ